MLWWLLKALGCFISIGSVVFAAPQDTVFTSVGDNIVENVQFVTNPESDLITEEVEVTHTQSVETSTHSEYDSFTNVQENLKINPEVYANHPEESETQEVATQRDEPTGTILTQIPTDQGQNNNQKPAADVSTFTQETSSNTPATITITRPTKKPNRKPKPARSTPATPVLQDASSAANSLVEAITSTSNQKRVVETATVAQEIVTSNSTQATITITRPTKKPIKKPKPVRTTTAKPVLEDSTSAANSLVEAITETSNQKPAVETATIAQQILSSNSTQATITITRPTKKPTKKPKPVRATTAKPALQDTPVTTVASTSLGPLASSSPPTTPTRRYPCRCGGGVCSCCTGIILENFNFPFRSRACANVSYEPDEFAFNLKLAYNDRVLYNTRVSAKNPPPACIPINRYFGIKMCAKLTNVFFSGRNVHACLEMEGIFDDEPTFNYPFNCFRIGSNGVAFVRPEDGGGLPPPPDEEEQTDEDYDDSARGWVGDVQPVPI